MSMIAGMCQSCYEAWRYAGKPDLDEWVPKRRRKLRQVQAVHQTRGEKGNGARRRQRRGTGRPLRRDPRPAELRGLKRRTRAGEPSEARLEAFPAALR